LQKKIANARRTTGHFKNLDSMNKETNKKKTVVAVKNNYLP
jgi:hypothetical protein